MKFKTLQSFLAIALITSASADANQNPVLLNSSILSPSIMGSKSQSIIRFVCVEQLLNQDIVEGCKKAQFSKLTGYRIVKTLMGFSSVANTVQPLGPVMTAEMADGEFSNHLINAGYEKILNLLLQRKKHWQFKPKKIDEKTFIGFEKEILKYNAIIAEREKKRIEEETIEIRKLEQKIQNEKFLAENKKRIQEYEAKKRQEEEDFKNRGGIILSKDLASCLVTPCGLGDVVITPNHKRGLIVGTKNNSYQVYFWGNGFFASKEKNKAIVEDHKASDLLLDWDTHQYQTNLELRSISCVAHLSECLIIGKKINFGYTADQASVLAFRQNNETQKYRITVKFERSIPNAPITKWVPIDSAGFVYEMDADFFDYTDSLYKQNTWSYLSENTTNEFISNAKWGMRDDVFKVIKNIDAFFEYLVVGVYKYNAFTNCKIKLDWDSICSSCGSQYHLSLYVNDKRILKDESSSYRDDINSIGKKSKVAVGEKLFEMTKSGTCKFAEIF